MSDNKIHKSTLNFNRKEGPGSQKLKENAYKINLHVRQTPKDFINMIIPRGIDIKVWGTDVHNNRLAEGSLITAYCTDINPNELCKREYDELLNFVNTKLSVIRDSPAELKGREVNVKKIIAEINTEEKADKAFNLVEDPDGKVYGQL